MYAKGWTGRKTCLERGVWIENGKKQGNEGEDGIWIGFAMGETVGNVPTLWLQSNGTWVKACSPKWQSPISYMNNASDGHLGSSEQPF